MFGSFPSHVRVVSESHTHTQSLPTPRPPLLATCVLGGGGVSAGGGRRASLARPAVRGDGGCGEHGRRHGREGDERAGRRGRGGAGPRNDALAAGVPAGRDRAEIMT